MLSFENPNPILKQREKKPMLQRRAERSRHCALCVQNVYCNWPAETVTSCEDKCAKGTISREEYLESMQKYIDGLNGGAPRCKRPADAPTRSKMQVTKSKQLAIVRNCGIFWEEAAWNAAVADKTSPAYGQPTAHASEVAVLPLDGDVKIKGVVREESFGKPIGTYTLSEGMIKSMRLVTDVADSNVDGPDPNAVWSQASYQW